MHAVLTLKLPFFNGGDEDNKNYVHRLMNEPLDLESDKRAALLTPAAKDILHGMLDKDPARRFTINQVLAHPWLN